MSDIADKRDLLLAMDARLFALLKARNDLAKEYHADLRAWGIDPQSATYFDVQRSIYESTAEKMGISCEEARPLIESMLRDH